MLNSKAIFAANVWSYVRKLRPASKIGVKRLHLLIVMLTIEFNLLDGPFHVFCCFQIVEFLGRIEKSNADACKKTVFCSTYKWLKVSKTVQLQCESNDIWRLIQILSWFLLLSIAISTVLMFWWYLLYINRQWCLQSNRVSPQLIWRHGNHQPTNEDCLRDVVSSILLERED